MTFDALYSILTCQYALDYISRVTYRDRRPISRHIFPFSRPTCTL